MPLGIHQPDCEIMISGDPYIMQRLPGHALMVINDNYVGLRILDPLQMDVDRRIPFSTEYQSTSGIVDSWCFRADGAWALVLGHDSGLACLLALDPAGPTYTFARPPFRIVDHIAYIWDTNTCWLARTQEVAFYELQWHTPPPHFVEKTRIQARMAHKAWGQAVSHISSFGCNVLRTIPDRQQLLFHDFSQHPGQIGVMDWQQQQQWHVPAPEYVPRLALWDDQFFILHEYAIDTVGRDGHRQVFFEGLTDYSFADLDTLPASGDHPPALVALAKAHRGLQAKLLMFFLDD